MNEGRHSRIKHWKNEESACARMKAYKSFEVEREYDINWHERTVDGVDFYYCIMVI